MTKSKKSLTVLRAWGVINIAPVDSILSDVWIETWRQLIANSTSSANIMDKRDLIWAGEILSVLRDLFLKSVRALQAVDDDDDDIDDNDLIFLRGRFWWW